MPWTIAKHKGGWWYVREVVEPFGNPDFEQVTQEVRQRNSARRQGKRTDYLMARREFEQSERTYSEDPEMKRLAERLS